MSNREELLNRIASYDFAIVELHLFLDTHPNNNAAAAKLDENIAKSNKLRKEFEDKYGPLNAMNKNADRWAWIANPWPWDIIKEGDK